MFKVKILKYTKNKNEWLCISYMAPSNKTYYEGSDNFSGIFFFLNDEIHNWLLEDNIEYSIFYSDDEQSIIFEKVEDVILFKLTWG